MISRALLDRFCNEVAYFYLLMPEVQREVEASGIDFRFLNSHGFLAAEVVSSYQDKRRTMSHDLAISEISRELSFIERALDSSGPSQIPMKAELLREKYQELYAAYELDELSKKVQGAKTSAEKKRILETMQTKTLGGVESAILTDAAVAFLPELYEKAQARESIKTIPGFENLSLMIGGFNRKRLAMVMAATGYGKTNLALNLSLQAARAMGVAYVNMEMSFEDMIRRVAVISMGITYNQFHRAEFSLDEAIRAISRVGDRFVLTSGRALSVNAISAWARIQKESLGIELLVIDYDQKLDLGQSHKDEWRAMQDALLKIEELAKELDLYIIVLAQVNRHNQISSSFRSTFGAHTVLHFMDDETHGPVIKAIKNRHGKRNQAIRVKYDEPTSTVSELDVISLSDDERPKLNFKRSEARAPYADN